MSSCSGGEGAAAVIFRIIGPPILTAACLIPLVWILWLVEATTARQHRAEQEAARQFERTRQSIEEECPGAVSVIACENEMIDASRDHQRSEYDLAAQENMAQYALAAVFLALAGVVVTSVATFFVYRTLRATLEAVNEARGATDAARRAVDVTEQMGRVQARAYIDAIAAHVHYDAGYASVRVTLRNGGQTPAKEITLYGATDIIDARLPIDPPHFASLVEGRPWGPLRTAGDLTFPILCDETASHYSAVVEAHGPLTIRAFGRIRYTTVFDETYETEFSFHTNKASNLIKSGPDGGLMEDPLVMWHSPDRLRTYQCMDQPDNGN